ncbi:MAG: hypothetical protein LBQ12_00545 [Deltaproteobacteria bacterium]|nr:hypothetical protein [Deltaproteobacteria bacterium]
MAKNDSKTARSQPKGGLLLEWKENGVTRRLVLDCADAESGRVLQIRWLDPAESAGTPAEKGNGRECKHSRGARARKPDA